MASFTEVESSNFHISIPQNNNDDNNNNDVNVGSTTASSSSTASTSSRYENQKRRDWNTFGQYLKNHRPPLTLSRCSGAHVLEFLRYLDQFGKTKVHVPVGMYSLVCINISFFIENGSFCAQNILRSRMIREGSHLRDVM